MPGAELTGTLQRRLLAPQFQVSIEALQQSWFHDRITATMPGFGVLAGQPTLLRKLRGAIGAVLTQGASAQARIGAPCPWSPPCALDVFFREQGRLTRGLGIPKPYVLAATRHGQNLRLHVTIFGFATDWTAAIAEKLPEALIKNMNWPAVAPDVFLPRPHLDRLTITSYDGLPAEHAPAAADLTFATQMNAEGHSDILDRPWTILGKLLTRIEALACWFDTRITENWKNRADDLKKIDYDISALTRHGASRIVERSSKNISVPIITGTLGLTGNLNSIWPYIQIGQTTHIGKGATIGQGLYIVEHD